MSFFKTYDCRGKYGEDATEANCFRLGAACNAFSDKLVLGMDYREHNDSLAEAFLGGFDGVVSSLGNVPSPVVAFNSSSLGVSFTASHNPAGYNGVKFKKERRCFFQGELAGVKREFELRKAENKKRPLPQPNQELVESYVSSLPAIESGIFDLAGGAACALKKIFPETIFSEQDPSYSKHSPEPTEGALDVLAKKTLSGKVGFAFDGDADRAMVVDKGKVIDGAFSAAFICSRLPKGSKVLVTLDTPAEVFRFIENSGLNVEYTPVGDVFLLEKMLESGADFAAERSGHFSFAKHMPDSDGIYSAAFLSSLKPGELLGFSKQFRNVSLITKVHFSVDFAKLESLAREKAERVDAMDGVKAEMEDFTFLVRASKTEPKVRVNVEAETKEKAEKGKVFVESLLQKCRVG
ncbi:hypothetical protein HZC09_06520 [Candidatus Micrarchaeota archaeon]|nr:hypothetical protein [Candidatus Micrarchaeota archaeon]